jgi:hypothetical protein
MTLPDLDPGTWIALLALGVSAYNTVHNTITSRATRTRRARVTISMGGAISGGRARGPALLMVTAANPGQIPITLNYAGIEFADGKQAVFLLPRHVKFPHTLAPGDSCTASAIAADFALDMREEEGRSGVQKIRGLYKDAVGARYRSKRMKFDLDGWADVAAKQEGR